jgi:Tol biopolymer transport system component/DNA-binding winged helix-turn-helix (wHTH) protein
MPENGVYRFGVFELDSRARELKKHGVRIKLQDQPLRILLMLAQHPGEVVTREQIQSELWPAGTYVDYENAINSSVRKLREALGDSSANPRFIETLARRGYRLLVPVSCNGAEDLRPEQPPPPVRRARWPLVSGAGVVAVIALAALLLSRHRSPHELVLPPAVPLTSYPGRVCCPSFSPDGTRVAFAWTGPDGERSHIYAKLVGQGEPVRLTTGAAEDMWPAWSPDGRSIAFQRFARGETSLLVIPAMGGREQDIAHLGTGEQATTVSQLSWSANGKSLFAVDGGPETAWTWITRVSVESGDKVRITFPQAEYRDESPAVSPDGTRLAFTRGAGFGMNIYVVELGDQGHTPRSITSDTLLIESLAWSPDGRYLVFSAARGGGSALWQVPADGSSHPVPLTGGGENSHEVAISGQGRLVYSSSNAVPHLWRLPVGGGSNDTAARFLPSTRQDFFPQYSPDGRRIVFESNRSGDQEVWISDADGLAPAQLTFLRAWSGTPRWSPSGDKIAFDSNSTGRFQIYVIGSGGGKPVQLTANRGLAAIPSWSRDGKWIYFASDQTGRGEIWKIPAAGGRAIQVTRNGGTIAFEAASGQELYFSKSSVKRQQGLWRMALPDGAEEQIAGPLAGRNFEVGARGVYFVQGSPEGATLKFFHYGSRLAETIATLGSGEYWGLTISPDERTALFSRLEVTGAELMLVEGFGRKGRP